MSASAHRTPPTDLCVGGDDVSGSIAGAKGEESPGGEEPRLEYGRTAADLRKDVLSEPDWLIPGWIAPGWSAELNGREKSGKGSLVAYLIGALERGEATVFGAARERPATSLIYTEEPAEALREKLDLADVRDSYVVSARDMRALDWTAKYIWLVEAAVRLGAGLLFIDNISRATGTEDEAGREAANKVEPLADLAGVHGIALLYDRHQRKSGGRIEDRSRGGTALGGAADVIVSLEKPPGDFDRRDRTLYAVGRVMATNWVRSIERDLDGRGYTLTQHTDYLTNTVREPGVGHRWTAVTFAEAIGRKPNAARNRLRELVAEGVLSLDDTDKEHGYVVLPTTDQPAID